VSKEGLRRSSCTTSSADQLALVRPMFAIASNGYCFRDMSIVAEPTLQQLRYLVALADHRHFGAAASACFVSQPALSAQIRKLERRLGATLLERHSSGATLTAAGEAAVVRAQVVLTAVHDLMDEVALAEGEITGLRIGVIPSLAPYFLPRLIKTVNTEFPAAVPYVEELRIDPLAHEVSRGDMDVGLIATPADTADLHVEEVGPDPLLLAMPLDHPLAGDDAPLPAEELEGLRVLLLEEGNLLRSHTIQVCDAVGAEPTDVHGTSVSTLVQMVAAGLGVTLIPSSAVLFEAREGNGIVVRPLSGEIVPRSVALVWRPTTPVADRLVKLAALLRPGLSESINPLYDERRSPLTRRAATRERM
jgi:LysR family transcriptional regulator, hydrogen peroxide-inducible genes activator